MPRSVEAIYRDALHVVIDEVDLRKSGYSLPDTIDVPEMYLFVNGPGQLRVRMAQARLPKRFRLVAFFLPVESES